MEQVEWAQARGLIVGQSPPLPPEKLPHGYQPLQGGPERRLAKLAGFESPSELWAIFDRIDLLGWCPGPKDRKDYHLLSCGYRKHRCDGHRFPLRAARLAAGRLKSFAGLAEDYSVVVLCGRLVAAAFGLRLRCVPWAEEVEGIRFLVMPHPSGVSHFWNDDTAWLRAAAAFRAALSTAKLSSPASIGGLKEEARLAAGAACGESGCAEPPARKGRQKQRLVRRSVGLPRHLQRCSSRFFQSSALKNSMLPDDCQIQH
mmetsp:Transcript_18139/g.42123  ORF Transcript_18139/g.42123 Transcript_18139/m.42123 type:complete len:258 (+) Transcript_18139:49-822(+)